MKKRVLAGLLLALAAGAQTDRSKKLELNTPYVPPPGDPVSHHAAGLAKVVCSAVFISGFQPEFAVANLGLFVSPLAERAKLGAPDVDRKKQAVHVKIPSGGRRTAVYTGSQGCVTLPQDDPKLHFTPQPVRSSLPPAGTQPWPMGDRLPESSLPKEVDAAKLKAAVDAAFQDERAKTAAVIVLWRGRLIAERYGPGVTKDTPLESWSMGKSTTATLMGLLIREGVYDLWQPAPVPEWQQPGDPRGKIRIADLLRMSSGLRIRAPLDPGFDPKLGYPDHTYLYTGAVNTFQYAATRPLQYPPNTVGRYRNTDPALGNYLVRLAVEKRGESYHQFPQRALFDRLGIRRMVIETDPWGNFLAQGYDYGTARDWARLGLLYQQDGMWMGKRLLPEGFVKFVSTVAPAWEAEGRPVYGGFFWVNGDGAIPAPRDAYSMNGAGGQWTFIIPSHDLVVVRMGHFSGEAHAPASLHALLKGVLAAVPAR